MSKSYTLQFLAWLKVNSSLFCLFVWIMGAHSLNAMSYFSQRCCTSRYKCGRIKFSLAKIPVGVPLYKFVRLRLFIPCRKETINLINLWLKFNLLYTEGRAALGGTSSRSKRICNRRVQLKIKPRSESASRPLIKKRLIMPNVEYAPMRGHAGRHV